MARKDVTNGYISQDMEDANDNFIELYLTKTEVETARDGEDDLTTKLQAIEADISTVTTEVTNARDGEANLLSQVDAIQADIVTLQETSISELGLPALETGKYLTNNGSVLSWDAVQETLVSGTNIKTVNSTTILGSGNIAVQATLVSGTNIKTVGGNTLLGSGDLPVYEVSPYSVTSDARTSNTALDADDKGKLISCTTTFTQTFTDAATLGSGWWCFIKNAGTGVITLDPDGAEEIDSLTTYAMYPGEVRLVQCTGTAFYTTIKESFYHTFEASGTFTKPPGYSAFAGRLWGAGGGGSVGTQPHDPGNGCGGGGGGCVLFNMPSSDFSATETITIGAGGAGVAGGSIGGNSSVGSLRTAYGGSGMGPDHAKGGNSNVAGLTYITNGADTYIGGRAATSIARHSIFGGGGGHVGDSVWGGSGSGGSSTYGGDGGATGGTGVNGGNGSIPAGGGGGSYDATPGDGARGELQIWGIK